MPRDPTPLAIGDVDCQLAMTKLVFRGAEVEAGTGRLHDPIAGPPKPGKTSLIIAHANQHGNWSAGQI